LGESYIVKYAILLESFSARIPAIKEPGWHLFIRNFVTGEASSPSMSWSSAAAVEDFLRNVTGA
jgi:hypothetical protein